MSSKIFGTIAALELSTPPSQGFEDIVEELDIAFQPVGISRRCLIWHNEDTAIIERDTLRVLLSWIPGLHEEGPSFLILAVGRNREDGPLVIDRPTCDFIKEALIAHLDSYLSFDTVFHTEAMQPIGTELIDTVTEILERDYVPARNPDPAQDRVKHCGRKQAWSSDPDGLWQSMFQRFGANRTAADPDSGRDRTVPAEIGCSLPQRLTIYTLGATMLLYTPPIGASLLIYTTLRDLVPASV